MRDEVAALFFDRAVFLFGSEVDADLSTVTEGAKTKKQAAARQQRVLDKWLGGGKTTNYKDPATKVSGTGGVIESVPGARVAL